MAAPVVPLRDLAAMLDSFDLELSAPGQPRTPLVFVDLREDHPVPDAVRRTTAVLVGLGAGADPEPFTCTLVPAGSGGGRATVPVADLDDACSALESAVGSAPRAAVTLAALLRCTAQLPVADGLVAESLAYSMLLAGSEFRAWRDRTPKAQVPPDVEPPVLVTRSEETLHITLNRPARHNAFGRGLRDGLVDALELVLHDETLTRVEVRGAGGSFCSGGDLDEFGTMTDVSTAHLIRLDRSVAARLDRCRDRVHVIVHGACIGAGIEIPSFAAHVTAQANAFFQLPELAMGLVPGAGGTVGLTRRIGRWRTAYLALTGAGISVDTAVDWGLVDDRVD